jgi:hypothetical protein
MMLPLPAALVTLIETYSMKHPCSGQIASLVREYKATTFDYCVMPPRTIAVCNDLICIRNGHFTTELLEMWCGCICDAMWTCHRDREFTYVRRCEFHPPELDDEVAGDLGRVVETAEGELAAI